VGISYSLGYFAAALMILSFANVSLENDWTKVRSGLMSDGDKTTMNDKDDGFGLAAFLLLSGILARLQARGINSPNDTRLLLDRAILTLENMPFQDEAIRKARGWLLKASSSSQVEEKASAKGSSMSVRSGPFFGTFYREFSPKIAYSGNPALTSVRTINGLAANSLRWLTGNFCGRSGTRRSASANFCQRSGKCQKPSIPDGWLARAAFQSGR
jgi:hypothetical protein